MSARENDAEGVKVSEESCSPATEGYTPEEKSVHQLEQLLATMRVNLEKSKLQEARVGTVVADAIKAVGPVLFFDVEIEGYPVRAVVDTGAQSTIVSR